ncbi:MBL fold metallo-hydrolase [Pontimicrobium aquaticum]|uniref:Metallo-beta-lactamase domain-containing protein n=1 Tax=Pontimicrobium aquaticum TaxID=2565367 RepID=A0A4U0F0P7_9FLAO|nr:MBL fold metallo-hydrolase [Pontimicrobium aquaticum]TJY37798.1 hypothetical protein E5167_00660 [Pontimicrobium aquaticum]
MKHNRIITLLIIVLMVYSASAQLDLSKSKLEIEKVGKDIYLFVQQTNITNPSSIVYSSPELSILIDPGYKQMQLSVKDSINALNGGSIKFIMTSHFHLDHVQAMENYYNNTTILLSSNQQKNISNMDIKNIISSDDKYHLKLGQEELEIHSFPNTSGHTDSDALFFFKQANVLIVGDYLFQDMYPRIDLKGGGGSIDGYFKNIDYILSLADNNTKIIPGHTSFKEVKKRYLSKKEYSLHINKIKESISKINAMKTKGLSIEEALKQGLPEKFKYLSEGAKYVSQDKWITFIYNNL